MIDFDPQVGWYGWRIVRASGIGHAFKRPAGRSLCGRVEFAGEPRKHAKYRPCSTCSLLWSAEYPKNAA